MPEPEPATALQHEVPATTPVGSVRAASRRPVIRQYDLVERVRAYDPDADEDLLNRAYVYAMKMHGAQTRASGDPYFHHPVEVAGILTALRLDAATIATALLHDVIEDTSATTEDLTRLFGPVVTRLVDGVTKLTKLEHQSPQNEQAENFRKLLLAMSEDIRVLLVKLADRLHNMRTLSFIRAPEKRRRIALETMEIYVPLAARIGMEAMKGELEDLAFAELQREARESVVHRLKQLRRDDNDLIRAIVDELRDTLREVGIEPAITGREKSAYSIWKKMERKNVGFEQLSDIMAFRVLVANVNECYAALGAVHSSYSMLPGRFKDFISLPKPNGYKSLHTTIIGPQNRKIEVQIRTREMHEVAELGVAAHWAYKDGARVTEGKRYRWIRELLEILEHAVEPEEFLANTKLEMYHDQVFCFTPKGDLIALPRGATPVDFAYAVHSEVGDHCVGARIDGRMTQLRTELQNGDQVEIITSKNAAPSASWERFVVTGRARARIRRHLRGRQRGEAVAHGREALQRYGKGMNLSFTDKQLTQALASFPYKSVDDLLVAVAEGNVTTRSVVDAVTADAERERPAADPQEEVNNVVPLRRRAQPGDEQKAGDAPILGLPPGVVFSYAGCCRPVPGDRIVGVVRTGRTVSLHRSDCSTLHQNPEDVQRAIDLAWNVEVAPPSASARLDVVCFNKPGVLGTISTAIGKQNANINEVRFVRRDDDLTQIHFDIQVSNIDQLHHVLATLRTMSSVCSVERMRQTH